MFTQMIFLMIIMLLASFGNVTTEPYLLLQSLIGFLCLLALIVLQTKILRKGSRNREPALFIVNCEIVLFLAYINIFAGLPQWSLLPSTSSIIINVLLYFVGLFTYYWSLNYSSKRTSYAIRLLVPFIIPFLIFTFISDMLNLAGISLDNLPVIAISLVGIIFAYALLAVLPPILLFFWKCTPLEENDLQLRLESLCQRANFRHGGMKIWNVINHLPTAAIIGILPRLRYIMFTHPLLNTLSPNAVESVLAHEIGHSANRHLLKFPFILLGLGVSSALIMSFISTGLTHAFNLIQKYHPMINLENAKVGILFLITALLVALYIRFIFGYFSRIFEREADMYGMEIGIPVSHMIEALDSVAIASGYTHDVPSWHHDSISERIRFLKRAEQNPQLIARHHQKVRYSIFVYLLCLLLGFAFLTAPLIPEYQPFKFINTIGLTIEKSFDKLITWPLRDDVAK